MRPPKGSPNRCSCHALANLQDKISHPRTGRALLSAGETASPRASRRAPRRRWWRPPNPRSGRAPPWGRAGDQQKQQERVSIELSQQPLHMEPRGRRREPRRRRQPAHGHGPLRGDQRVYNNARLHDAPRTTDGASSNALAPTQTRSRGLPTGACWSTVSPFAALHYCSMRCCTLASTLIAAALWIRAAPSLAQARAEPLNIVADDPNARLEAEQPPLRVSDAPDSTESGCTVPCGLRVVREQRVFITGTTIADSRVFTLPTGTNRLTVRSQPRDVVAAFDTRRAVFFGTFGALVLPTIGVGGVFGWLSRNNIGGIRPGGTQEHLLIATVTLSTVTIAALISGIVNEALHPGGSQVIGVRGFITGRLRFDGVSF